jgi:hypothetical protein
MRTAVATAAVLLAGVAPASARAGIVPASLRPWATVNVCDSIGHPDSIGIRGSMPPAVGRGVEMFMRFQVQYLTIADARWRDLGPGADSDFIDIGPSRLRPRQFGQTFTVTPPPAGQPPHQLRGVVTFEWRRDGVVLRHVRRRTTAGHPDTPGSDPLGYSAATCQIS